MIIDKSYFFNKLNLPQIGNTEGEAEVNDFIEQYEPEYLQCVLGYDLWEAFIEGIDGSGIADQRWLDLLQGKKFTYRNCTYKWNGFAPVTAGGTYDINYDAIFEMVAGGADTYDPAPGSTITIPPDFVGANLSIEVRGTGTLRASEYSISGNVITLAVGFQPLNNGTVVFLKKDPSLTIASGSLTKISPIANYVFYQFADNKTTDFTLIGEVVSTTDNNRKASPIDRMIDAWNRMVDMNTVLQKFLKANKTVYPEWKEDTCGCDCDCSCDCDCYNKCKQLFEKKNSLGL